MRNKQITLSVTLLIAWELLLPMQADAYIGLCCAKCGGNMPMNIPGGGIPETHEFRFKLQPMQMHMSGLQQGNHHVGVDSVLGMPLMMGKPTGKYMAAPTSMDMSMLNLSAGYSVSDDFFLGIMGMYIDNRMDMQFSSMMKGSTGQAGYTMESSGLGDTMLMAKYRLFADDPLFPSTEISLFTGLSIPTGSISKHNTTHPLTMRKNELLPYNMQLGSGTWDPTIGLLYQRSSSPFWWGFNARYTQRTGSNSQGYRQGNKTQIDGYLMYQADSSVVFYGELQGLSTGHIHGEADQARTGASGHASKGNPASPYMTPLWDPTFTGKTQAFTTVGVQWQPIPLQILDVGIEVPVYQRMNGLQLKDRWRLMFSWYVELPTDKSIRALSHSPADEALGF